MGLVDLELSLLIELGDFGIDKFHLLDLPFDVQILVFLALDGK